MTDMNRRTAIGVLSGGAAPLVAAGARRPNVLFLMTDQHRFDAIAAHGNPHIYTPNLDRLARRGVTFTNAYSGCPVCLPARYMIRTGCDPGLTQRFHNGPEPAAHGLAATMTGRCGPYLAQTMSGLGYRTFGIGKFHTDPWDEALGYQVHLHSEELYSTPDQRRRDSFAAWIAEKRPAYDFIEALMGERTEMYYMPQMSPMPASATVEGWAAARAVEQINHSDPRPFFGFVSFIGPHPPFAPPLPFNRIYDPDRMPNPVRGSLALDHMDEQIPWMNYAIWAEDVNDPHARVLKARYYGEITYIDDCIGQILDALEKRPDAENTLICFFADHGDLLGDHHGWQKECYFEASCHVPFLVSWPAQLAASTTRGELAALTDLFGIATTAAGNQQLRQGVDLLGAIEGRAPHRTTFFGYYGNPGSRFFKIMARSGDWKYIYMANGGRRQLFNVARDPNELEEVSAKHPDIVSRLHSEAEKACGVPGVRAALDANGLRAFPFEPRPLRRIYQFDHSRGVRGFPRHPADVLKRA